MPVVSSPSPSRGASDEGDPSLRQVPGVPADGLALSLLGQARSQDDPSQLAPLRAGLCRGPPPSLWGPAWRGGSHGAGGKGGYCYQPWRGGSKGSRGLWVQSGL